jgi:2-polyprenyl-3-methyl-5-hydroxy-6-metoxy-1,4-benzoquinol methylase
MSRKEHWENIYSNKKMNEVSWFQQEPTTSLALIQKNTQSKDDAIIDIGGGDGFLVDNLLELGYTNITVLDISANAINKAKERLGINADKVKWIVSDITEFIPAEQYDIWHDRAVFHFLNQEQEIEYYKVLVDENISDNGHFILATFADDGPEKCSGLEVCKYSEKDMENSFSTIFKVKESFKYKHLTPFGAIQNFTFSVFRK